MIRLPLQLSSPSRMVYPWLLPCLVALVILLPGLSVWANDRGDDRDEEEAEFNRDTMGRKFVRILRRLYSMPAVMTIRIIFGSPTATA
jgi:hypothetical protein